MNMMSMMYSAARDMGNGMMNGVINGMMQMAPWLAILWLLLQVGFLALVVLGVVWLVRALRDKPDKDGDSALAILRERYARGEIEEEEFETRKRQLES